MKNVIAYLSAGPPLPKSAVAVLFLFSLAYLQLSDLKGQISGYWPGVDVFVATCTLLLGGGASAISAWVSQRWPVRLRTSVSSRSGWAIAVRDVTRMYSVVLAVFIIDLLIVVGYRYADRGAGHPKYAVLVNSLVWLLFAVTVGWAIGSLLRRAAAVFAAAAAALLLSAASVMANDGHRLFPLLAARQLPALRSYAVELSPNAAILAVGIVTTLLLVTATIAVVTMRRTRPVTTTLVALTALVPVLASAVSGGAPWLEPRAAAAAPVCTRGEQLQVCSWPEDEQRLAMLAPVLPRLAEAMRNTGYPVPGRLSVSTSTTPAESVICPFRAPEDGVLNILGRAPVGSPSCHQSDRPVACVGDAELRTDFLSLTQVYMSWLGNYALGKESIRMTESDGSPTTELRAVETVSEWAPEAQFSYMSQVYRTVTECTDEPVSALLAKVGAR